MGMAKSAIIRTYSEKNSFCRSKQGFILNSNGDLLTTADQGFQWTIQRNFRGALAMDIKDSTIVLRVWRLGVY